MTVTGGAGGEGASGVPPGPEHQPGTLAPPGPEPVTVASPGSAPPAPATPESAPPAPATPESAPPGPAGPEPEPAGPGRGRQPALPWALAVALAGGLALTAAFPPVGFWPLAAVGPALLVVALWQPEPAAPRSWSGWCSGWRSSSRCCPG